MNITRRRFFAASAAVLTSVAGCSRRRVTIEPDIASTGAKAEPRSELDEANEHFLNGDYKEALSRFTALAFRKPEDQDLKLAAVSCYACMGDFKNASQTAGGVTCQSPDDFVICANVHARAEDFAAAQRAMLGVPEDQVSDDVDLLEAMALAAAKSGNRAEAWRHYRRIQRHDPSSSAIDRLADSGLFSFTTDWFGYGASSLLNYSKGFGSGVVGWTVDTVKGLWQLVRHPINTATSAIDASFAGTSQFAPQATPLSSRQLHTRLVHDMPPRREQHTRPGSTVQKLLRTCLGAGRCDRRTPGRCARPSDQRPEEETSPKLHNSAARL
jgi:hypothetical protein